MEKVSVRAIIWFYLQYTCFFTFYPFSLGLCSHFHCSSRSFESVPSELPGFPSLEADHCQWSILRPALAPALLPQHRRSGDEAPAKLISAAECTSGDGKAEGQGPSPGAHGSGETTAGKRLSPRFEDPYAHLHSHAKARGSQWVPGSVLAS